MTITGLLILRNGITNGYTVAETVQCLLGVADDLVVLEGHSTDSTMLVLRALQDRYPDRIIIKHQVWNTGSSGGHEFAHLTNAGLKLCRDSDYVFMLQANEVLHERAIGPLRAQILSGEFTSITLHYKHFRYSLRHVVRSEGVYPRAIRVMKTDIPDLGADHDGYTLGGAYTEPGHDFWMESPYYWCYRFGYVFYYNILLKMQNHAQQFYVTEAHYQERARLAQLLLDRMRAGEQITGLELHSTLEPHWPLQVWELPIPSCMEKHAGRLFYDPRLALPELPELPELAGLPDYRAKFGGPHIARIHGVVS